MFSKIYDKVKNYIVNNYKFLIALVLIFVICLVELPFVVYKPGGIIYLSDRITVEDAYKDLTSGNSNEIKILVDPHK